MVLDFPRNLCKAAAISRSGHILRRNYIRLLLNQAMDLFEAEAAGIVFGTNETRKKFLPPQEWDRGILGHVTGRGIYGQILRWFGPWLAQLQFSPGLLARKTNRGTLVPGPGYYRPIFLPELRMVF